MLANINRHGAWIMVGNQGTIVGQYATVDGAVRAIAKIIGPFKDPRDRSGFKHWLPALAESPVGTIDCYDSAYPIIWYDPGLDECQYEVEDYEAWEEAVNARNR
jgi:hypothetical protein